GPLSITWVSPFSRAGRLRSKPCKESLQSLVGLFLDVVEQGVAVRVDADPERAEVLDAELPEALRHQVLPGDLLDLLDLGRLERRRAADDREVDHPETAHGLDRLVGKAALAADRANAVLGAEGRREANHSRGRSRRSRRRRRGRMRAAPPSTGS